MSLTVFHADDAAPEAASLALSHASETPCRAWSNSDPASSAIASPVSTAASQPAETPSTTASTPSPAASQADSAASLTASATSCGGLGRRPSATSEAVSLAAFHAAEAPSWTALDAPLRRPRRRRQRPRWRRPARLADALGDRADALGDVAGGLGDPLRRHRSAASHDVGGGLPTPGSATSAAPSATAVPASLTVSATAVAASPTSSQKSRASTGPDGWTRGSPVPASIRATAALPAERCSRRTAGGIEPPRRGGGRGERRTGADRRGRLGRDGDLRSFGSQRLPIRNRIVNSTPSTKWATKRRPDTRVSVATGERFSAMGEKCISSPRRSRRMPGCENMGASRSSERETP